MASNEDCEALEILITERRQAVAAELEKQIKKEKNDQNSKDPLVIKEKNKQTVHVTLLVHWKEQKNK